MRSHALLAPTAAENQALQAWAGSDGLLARVPWAHLFCCSGFLAVLLVEQAAKRLKSLNGGVLNTFDSDDEEHAGGGHRDTPSEESRGPCDGPRPPSGAASSMALPLVLAAFRGLLNREGALPAGCFQPVEPFPFPSIKGRMQAGPATSPQKFTA
eukprot:EG_transcript_25514